MNAEFWKDRPVYKLAMSNNKKILPKLRAKNWGDASGTSQIVDLEEACDWAWATGTFVVDGKVVLSFEELQKIASLAADQGEEMLDVLVFTPVPGG